MNASEKGVLMFWFVPWTAFWVTAWARAYARRDQMETVNTDGYSHITPAEAMTSALRILGHAHALKCDGETKINHMMQTIECDKHGQVFKVHNGREESHEGHISCCVRRSE